MAARTQTLRDGQTIFGQTGEREGEGGDASLTGPLMFILFTLTRNKQRPRPNTLSLHTTTISLNTFLKFKSFVMVAPAFPSIL